MGRHGWIALGIAGTTALGCGEIVEVPVATSAETTGGDTSQDEGSSTTAGPSATADSGGATTSPDVDQPSESGGGDDSTTGAGEPTQQPFCAVLRDPISIPEDGSAAQVTIEVPALAEVIGLSVSVRLSHTRVSNLEVTLLDPGGGSTRLLDHPACEGANVDAFFDDDAVQPGNDQCLADVSAIMGQVQPVDPLEGLLHASVAGTWTLAIIDDAAVPETQGSLDAACLVLTTGGR